jgi:redox-sensitive bicupin YhaK (pirin superfamily)
LAIEPDDAQMLAENPMIETRIAPRPRELGDGFQVRRALPDAARRSVGPFVFFDQMGPTDIAPGRGLDVRPHPHIGLATVTYLFEGEILHRDSLGTVQTIRPGQVNWMTAGRGIVHSERTPEEVRAPGSRLFGVQTWIALPLEAEECEPAFSHHANLPLIEDSGVSLRLILGDLLGLASPVPIHSPTFYADVSLEAMRQFVVPARHEERGLFVVEGALELGEETLAAGELAVLATGVEVPLHAKAPARFMLFGGAPPEGPRYIWWNFVSSRKERIEQAAADWQRGRFPTVPGETESIPLPEGGPQLADYP